MAECDERIAALRADYAGYTLNDLMVAAFKRMIRNVQHAHGVLVWGALHSRVGSRMPRTPDWWFRAHEGTYPCVYAGVLIGFCSPEFAAAFEALVAGGRLIVEINFSDVDRWGVPSASVRVPVSPSRRVH